MEFFNKGSEEWREIESKRKREIEREGEERGREREREGGGEKVRERARGEREGGREGGREGEREGDRERGSAYVQPYLFFYVPVLDLKYTTRQSLERDF